MNIVFQFLIFIAIWALGSFIAYLLIKYLWGMDLDSINGCNEFRLDFFIAAWPITICLSIFPLICKIFKVNFSD